MRAVLVSEFGGPEVLHMEDVPIPEPGDGQIRVRTVAAGVNPMDGKIRSGAAFFPVTLPVVLGREFAGVVDVLGAHMAHIHAFTADDSDAVVALWTEAGLTRPWNDPVKDVWRKTTTQPEMFLIAKDDEGHVVGSALAGYVGHRGGSTISPSPPPIAGQDSARSSSAAPNPCSLPWAAPRSSSKCAPRTQALSSSTRGWATRPTRL
ncbi:alcohol dehydrogenase catalytic domain-containing protein [Kocuria koreensis]|uniref:Alcohol dehydrogenase catalytic domain-containing protein n=1 Tax=Rothia koreensis TaxID=592378 RepID=A0A7K1LFL8_9MICC|nr:alcohol dehydrogenase catalytic domain-containing protein [Rothia koreensis]